jgi:hypothetical protein
MGVQATRDDRSGGGIGKLTCSPGKGTSENHQYVRHTALQWRVASGSEANETEGWTVTVNGWELPASFAEFFEREWSTLWRPKRGVDAYGHRFTANFEPLDSLDLIQADTAYLPTGFSAKEWLPEWIARNEGRPGFIPYIEDFSPIVQFGRQLTGSPYCFDFRESAQAPSVIFWDDGGCYWRRVAPDFDAFISLFERFRGDEEDG